MLTSSDTHKSWGGVELSPGWQRGIRYARNVALVGASLLILGILVWQGVTANGNPDPTVGNLSPAAAAVDAGILVFREGLEAILILAALTASLVRTQRDAWKPIGIGAGLSFLATIATWFIVVAIISSVNAPELQVQAGTGILAVVVLLVIMNWFFHKIYWTGWITMHNRRKQSVMESGTASGSAVYRGLLLVGFTCVYREGFEVVLFLQNLRLQAGGQVVLIGAMVGLLLTAIVAWLTFVAHHRLPYRKMLILTGIMLGGVLIVMVGETVQEMQLAHWMTTTPLGFEMPGWLNLWFAIYPTAESLGSQLLAGAYVIGTYFIAKWVRSRRPKKAVAAQHAARGEAEHSATQAG